MRIGRLKKDLKWNYGISFERHWEVYNPLAKIIMVWCFKLKKLPEDAGSIFKFQECKQVGFWWKKEIMTRWNIILYTKTFRFRIPYWIKIKKDK